MMPLWEIKKKLSHINAIVASLKMHQKDIEGSMELVDCLLKESSNLFDIECSIDALQTLLEQSPEPDYDD